MYKLLATDMDGTLLNEDSIITERTKAALRAAMDRGVLFVPSTGRPMCGMAQVLGAFDADLPMVLFNGAMAMTSKSRRVLFAQNLGSDYAREIYRIGMARDIPVIAWMGENLYVSRDCEATKAYRSITGAPMQIIRDSGDLGEATKILWIVPGAARYQAEMRERYDGAVNCFASQSHYLEFVDARASKGLALEAVGAAYGIAADEMIAVGDGYNDVSMLEYAGLGVAMGNAPEEIKGLCQAVTLGNDEDGVAVVIEKYIL